MNENLSSRSGAAWLVGAVLSLGLACGTSGKKVLPDAGSVDARPSVDGSVADASSTDAVTDAMPPDAAADVRQDADEVDAGIDAVVDAGMDAVVDAPVVDAPSADAPADVPSASLDVAADLSGDAGPADTSTFSCDAGTAPGSHLFFEFDSNNAEWVKSLRWLDSAGKLTENLVGYGGGPGCTSPYEFFGQAYAAPEGNGPYPVGGNNIATVTTCGADQTIVSQPLDCAKAAQIPVTTTYHFYDGAKADQVRITRTIGFDASTPKSTGIGMRVYVPRPRLALLPNVIAPNGAGAIMGGGSAAGCGGDCFTSVGTAWNGKWFADFDPTTGRAMIVLRDPSLSPSDVVLTVNNDSNSGSNLSSFVVLQPADGWKAPLTEIEYLCFADLTTWPQSARDAAILPAFCGP